MGWHLRGQLAGINFVIGDGVNVISAGEQGHVSVPFTCRVTRVVAIADQIGSIVVDLWVCSYVDAPPDDADSITAAAPVTLAAEQKSVDATLTDWTTTLTEGDILAFNVDSAATITRCLIALDVRRL